jgi:DNA-directed RNA polymerase specialized sigma24 family protein
MADDVIKWPPLDAVYNDEFGAVDPAIYDVAGELWPVAWRFTQAKLGDAALALQLMIKAVTIVSRRQAEMQGGIENPIAFLRRTFERLVLGELQKRNRRRELEDERLMELLPHAEDTAQNLDNKILIEQLYLHMDEWMKKAFELRVLEYSFEEMEAVFGMKANLIRSKYSKELKRLRRQIDVESREAEHRARRQSSH